MWVLMVEALVALSLLVFIVWWTMYAGRPKIRDGVVPDHLNDATGTEAHLQRMQDGPGQPAPAAPAAHKDGHGQHHHGNGEIQSHSHGSGHGHSHSDSHDGGSSDGGGSSD